jgi:hypothetical protein
MKIVTIHGVGDVTIKKSRLAKRLILKIDQSGRPLATIPSYMPYSIAESFIKKHTDWLREAMPSPQSQLLRSGSKIGKVHTLQFAHGASSTPKSRVGETLITITHPPTMNPNEPAVQNEAKKAAVRALRRQAEAVIPGLLHRLAARYGYTYSEVRIKAVQTRWGSCSSNRIINMSIWLMQLPDPLIEYVACHELAHLTNMNHGPNFWNDVAVMVPDYKQKRKLLKQYSPRLMQT